MIKYIFIFCITFSFQAFSKNWQLLTTEKEIQVFSLKDETSKSGVIPFKAVGNISAPLTEVINLLKDEKLKPKWSPKLKEVKIHKKISENEYIFSEYYKTPWPAFDREFLLYGQIKRINKDQVLFHAESIRKGDKNFKIYFNDDHIQADVKYINVTLTRIDNFSTQIDFEFHGDMKGWMPVWLMNLIQKKWPLRFIDGMRKQLEMKPTNSIAKN